MSYTSHDVLGFDYIEHWVGNARHSAHYYSRILGFEILGYMGPETGVRDRVSYLIKQNDIVMTLSSAIVPEHPIHDFVNRHSDGVKSYAFSVRDVREAYKYATEHGAESVETPYVENDEHGTMIRAALRIYGDTDLILIDRSAYKGLLPGYRAYEGVQDQYPSVGLQAVDHIVGNVEEGQMNRWSSWFEDCLDFETFVHFDKGDISTKYSALVSKVVRSKNDAVKLPINEAAEGLRKSQIEEYLDVNYGPGVQHIALRTNDIITTIGAMRGHGAEFLYTPDAYYELLGSRADGIKESIKKLEEYKILLDRDERGYLLQIFTKPVGDRPTLFFEIIQREGCEGFGQNNFQALFESIEHEQAKRGNL